jgi:hypothetical protein
MSPRAVSSCAVWLVSIAPIALANAEPWLAGVSRTGLCALPWFLYTSLPLGAVSGEEDARDVWVWIALALPPLAIAARIDLAAGLAAAWVAGLAATSLACAALLRLAALRCAPDARAARIHVSAWMAFVIGAPLLRAALERGGEPAFGAAPSWLALLTRASPLEALVRATTALGSDGVGGASIGAAAMLPPLALSLAFFAVSRRVPRAPLEASS